MVGVGRSSPEISQSWAGCVFFWTDVTFLCSILTYMSVSCSDISVLLFSQAQKLREKREAIDKAEKLKKKKQKKLAA